MRIEAIGFDFGETLIYYGDAPLSWKPLYEPALQQMAESVGRWVGPDEILRAAAVLERYNTRCNPRVTETTPADRIFAEILACWQITDDSLAESAARRFFRFFQKDAAIYPEVDETIEQIKRAGIKVGILSDVPYGMSKQLLQEDIQAVARFGPLLDALIISLDVGWRKPEPAGFHCLAEQLGTTPERMLYVGNEQKDIVGARRAGMTAVLICRSGEIPDWGQDYSLRSLAELLSLFSKSTPLRSKAP